MKNIDIIRVVQCDVCGKLVPDIGLNATSLLYQRVMSKSLCPECAFWDEVIENNCGNILTTSDKCYRVLPFQPCPPPGATLGSNGKRKYFLTTSGIPVMSNDVWLIGRVPGHFAKHFPTNAYLINAKAYNRLVKYNTSCDDSECPDRYRCYFYNWKDETSYTPLPRGYCPGSNQCPKFLPLRWIENYDYTK